MGQNVRIFLLGIYTVLVGFKKLGICSKNLFLFSNSPSFYPPVYFHRCKPRGHIETYIQMSCVGIETYRRKGTKTECGVGLPVNLL